MFFRKRHAKELARGRDVAMSAGGTEETSQPAPVEAPQKPTILPLTPQFDEASHRLYVAALSHALENERVHNIALSGHYGVGKSSILDKVAIDNKDLNPITISLSSLRVDTSGNQESITNQIQKEIVKQLLYREAPSAMPDSRYKRRERYDWKRSVLPVVIITLFLYLALHLAGLTAQLIPVGDASPYLLVLQYLLLYCVPTFLLIYLHATTFNRIWIDKVTTGSATLSLTKPTDTYFDEFLDELVYFFEISESQVIIFEDIDRFNDPTIFENLRALNTLLNNSKQLNGRSVRFIYAIRDSIFEAMESHPGAQSSARSNRTKFFDVIVPVVPFITHSNARDLMTTVMGDVKHQISGRLVRLVARHVTDMRVLKNVRNEFLIFRERIFGYGSPEDALRLSEDNLYAMILYKNTHLSDFEKVCTAESALDSIYREGRRIVNTEIGRLTDELAGINKKMGELNSLSTRCQQLGVKLVTALNCIQGLFSSPFTGMTVRTMSLSGSTIDEAGLEREQTWKALAIEAATLEVNFANASGQSIVMKFGSGDIAALVGESLSPEAWEKTDRAKLEDQSQAIRLEVEAMRKADIADLVRLNPSKVPAGNPGKGFRDFVNGTLKSELAQELAAGGYFDRDFTLYASVYHDVHVSLRAKNFLRKCVDQEVMDAEFELEPGDIEAVLSEVSEASLSLRGAYNINLLDFLLETDDMRGRVVVRALAELGSVERKFLRSYWIRGKQQLRLALELARVAPDILTYLVSDDSVPDVIYFSALEKGALNE